jgi:hypothetical protein
MCISEMLIGRWDIDPSDAIGLQAYGNSTMDFIDSHVLWYIRKSNDEQQLIQLTYRIEENCIVTNQPSQPREDRVQFEIDGNGNLILIRDSVRTRFIRRKLENANT